MEWQRGAASGMIRVMVDATPAPETRKSACPLDCPDSCSLEVTVADGRVQRIAGTRVNPLTESFICSKVQRFPDHLHGPDRLTTPGIRDRAKGEGRFRPVSWDEALSCIVEKVREVRERHGGEAILPFNYGGSNGKLTDGSVDERFFRRVGASRLARTVCAAATGRALRGLYGPMPGVLFEDFPAARLMVLWGVNPSVSGIHQVPHIRRALDAGARLVVVDPRRTPLAGKADLHLAVRPGTDLPVALSIIRWFFEEGAEAREFLDAHALQVAELRERARPWTFQKAADVAGVEARQLAELARIYHESSPALIRCGWGLERNRNGGSAVAAVLALPAVAGKLGVRGGGFTLSNSSAWSLDLEPVVNEPAPATRTVNMNRLGRSLNRLDDPPIELLFVYNCNPLATMPHQSEVRRGLERDDLFTVVHDAVLTDTARHADVVLPATTFLEHHELRNGYGSIALSRSRPVVEPVGEARPNYALFAELIQRLGLKRPGDVVDPDELVARILAGTGDPERLQRELDARGCSFPYEGEARVPFVDHFPATPDGKIHLVPEALDHEAPQGLYRFQPLEEEARFPLTLISPATRHSVSSTLAQLWRAPARVELNPEDAARRGIGDDDEVRVFNSLGEVRCLARVTLQVRSGVALLPKGLWSRHTRSGTTANTLAPDTFTDLGAGACFNDARVEI